mgnify:CR=1 FL=1
MNQVLLIIGISCFVFMIVQNLFFLVYAVCKSKKEGVVSTKMKSNILSSAIFSILPAFAVSLTIIPLARSLGNELVFIRSIFTGSVQDNILAAETILNVFGLDLASTALSPTVLVTVLWGTSLSGVAGLILIAFLSLKKKKSKKVIEVVVCDIQTADSAETTDVVLNRSEENTVLDDNIAVINVTENESENVVKEAKVEENPSKKKKSKWLKILSMSISRFGNLMYIGIIGVYFVKQIAAEGSPEVAGDGAGFLSLLTVLLSGGFMALFSKLGEKKVWLKNLAMPISMLLAFVIVMLLSLVIPENVANFEWRT